eukprot:gene2873-4716_t
MGVMKNAINTLKTLDFKSVMSNAKYLDPFRPSYKWLEKKEDRPKAFFYQLGTIIMLVVVPMQISKWRKNRAAKNTHED